MEYIRSVLVEHGIMLVYSGGNMTIKYMGFLLKEKRPFIPWSPHFLGPREKPNMQYTVMGQ